MICIYKITIEHIELSSAPHHHYPPSYPQVRAEALLHLQGSNQIPWLDSLCKHGRYHLLRWHSCQSPWWSDSAARPWFLADLAAVGKWLRWSWFANRWNLFLSFSTTVKGLSHHHWFHAKPWAAIFVSFQRAGMGEVNLSINWNTWAVLRITVHLNYVLTKAPIPQLRAFWTWTVISLLQKNQSQTCGFSIKFGKIGTM